MGLTCITGARECDCCGECTKYILTCSFCDEQITDYYYDINGRILCKDCLDDLYREEVE